MNAYVARAVRRHADLASLHSGRKWRAVPSPHRPFWALLTLALVWYWTGHYGGPRPTSTSDVGSWRGFLREDPADVRITAVTTAGATLSPACTIPQLQVLPRRLFRGLVLALCTLGTLITAFVVEPPPRSSSRAAAEMADDVCARDRRDSRAGRLAPATCEAMASNLAASCIPRKLESHTFCWSVRPARASPPPSGGCSGRSRRVARARSCSDPECEYLPEFSVPSAAIYSSTRSIPAARRGRRGRSSDRKRVDGRRSARRPPWFPTQPTSSVRAAATSSSGSRPAR